MSNPVIPIQKIGSSCPSGWTTQGGYCVAMSMNPKHKIPKSGSSCPSGYTTQGGYCVKL